MKHRHMIPCVVIAVIAMLALALTGSAPLGAGVGLALLLCPLVMGTVMWLLMRQPNRPATHAEHLPTELANQPQHTSNSPHQ